MLPENSVELGPDVVIDANVSSSENFLRSHIRQQLLTHSTTQKHKQINTEQPTNTTWNDTFVITKRYIILIDGSDGVLRKS